MSKRLSKALKNSRGFTILELIVVIAIMGFLVALVAPRLVGVADDSKGAVATTDMQRLTQAVGRYINETGRLPNYLNGMMAWKPQPEKSTEWGSIGFSLNRHSFGKYEDYFWKGDKSKQYTFPEKFARNKLFVHLLNTEEAEEIKAMGITKLISLEDGKEIDVKKDTKVLMIGAACNEDHQIDIVNNGGSAAGGCKGVIWKRTTNPHIPGQLEANPSEGETYARPDLIYRIVLGIGEESELVQKEFIKNAGEHPETSANKDYIKFRNYCLVLPRLQATIDKFHVGDADTTKYGGESLEGIDLAARKIKVEGLSKEGEVVIEEREIVIDKPQSIHEFEIIGLGDEVYPISDVYEWKVKEDPLVGMPTF